MAMKIVHESLIRYLLFKLMVVIVLLKQMIWPRSNNKVQRHVNAASIDDMIGLNEINSHTKSLSVLIVTKVDYEIISERGLNVNVPWLIMMVSKPVQIRKSSSVPEIDAENEPRTDHRTVAKSTRYQSSDALREDFSSLIEREYKDDSDGREDIKDIANIDDRMKRSGNIVLNKFCTKTHRCMLNVTTEANQSIKWLQNSAFYWDKIAINKILRRNHLLYPDMQLSKNRLKTFDYRWYFPQFNSFWSTKAFVDAGFFLTDEKGNMSCFSCGICIRHDIEDEPFKFHQNFSPHCIALQGSFVYIQNGPK